MDKDNVPNPPLGEHSLVSDPKPTDGNPDWSQWKSVKSTLLWKAVALLCDIAPNRLKSSFYPDKLDTFFNKATPKFTAILKRAENHVGTDLFKASFFNEDCPQDSEVELSVFTTWAKFAGYQFPIGYPWLPKETPHKNLDWPWGRHETDLLRNLAAAANRFWKLYDPADPSTAPTNKKVANWLKEQGVAHRNAEVMASILRPDELAPGPRK